MDDFSDNIPNVMRLYFWNKCTVLYDAMVYQVIRVQLDKLTVDMKHLNHLQKLMVFDLFEKLCCHLNIVSERCEHLVMY